MALDAELFDPEVKLGENSITTPEEAHESTEGIITDPALTNRGDKVKDITGEKSQDTASICPPFKHSHNSNGEIFIKIEDLPEGIKSSLSDPELLSALNLDPELPNKLTQYPPEVQSQIVKMAVDFSLSNPYDRTNIPGEIDIGEALSNWIWKNPPVTRVVLFASALTWLVSALPIDMEFKPTLCSSYFYGELTATGSALVVLKVLFWSLDSRSSFIATFSTIVLHREFKALEKRKGSIYAFGILCAIWTFELIAFLVVVFLKSMLPYEICLFGQMGLVFGVKQIQNAVYPREEKNFLCSNLYFPAFFHMFVGAALWQLVALAFVGTFDFSVFLGLFTGVMINISPACPRLCKGRIHGLKKKECFWLTQSPGYVSADESEVIVPKTRFVSNSQLRCRSPPRGNSSDSQNEETTHLLIDTVS